MQLRGAWQVLQQDAELKVLKTKMATIEEIMREAAEASQGGRKAMEQVSGFTPVVFVCVSLGYLLACSTSALRSA